MYPRVLGEWRTAREQGNGGGETAVAAKGDDDAPLGKHDRSCNPWKLGKGARFLVVHITFSSREQLSLFTRVQGLFQHLFRL